VPADLAALRTADEDEAAAFFAAVDPEQLVQAVAATSDDQLLELIDRAEVRPAAVQGLLSRLHEFSVPERLAELSGVVRFDLEHRGKVAERHSLVFAGGEMTFVRDTDDGDAKGAADVVVRTGLPTFVRMVSGEVNAGLAYLAGDLDIEGDADLALGVGGLFRVPGTGSVAVDPRALDPVDVATVLGRVKGGHLRAVMRSGFRPVVLGEIFRRLPEYVNPAKATKLDLTVGFRLTGDPSGEVERYVVRLADGTATVSEGDAGESRDATVTCEGHDFLRLATGHLNPVAGVVKGALKVRGSRAKALALAGAIDIPEAT
jgi:putative sterol carrier protein